MEGGTCLSSITHRVAKNIRHPFACVAHLEGANDKKEFAKFVLDILSICFNKPQRGIWTKLENVLEYVETFKRGLENMQFHRITFEG